MLNSFWGLLRHGQIQSVPSAHTALAQSDNIECIIDLEAITELDQPSDLRGWLLEVGG